MSRTQGDTYALAAEHANRIERASIIAHYASGEDVEYHSERARKAFAELAAVLGYTVSRAETVEEDELPYQCDACSTPGYGSDAACHCSPATEGSAS